MRSETKTKIRPDFELKPFGLKGPTVIGFGKNHGKTNWKTLIDSAITWDSKERKEIARTILETVVRMEVTKIFSPGTGTFNAKICEPADLKQKITLGRGVSIFRGHNAEGLIIPNGSAGAMFPADCNTIVVRSDDGIVGFAHCGGFSLIDHLAVLRGREKVRKFGSVVDALIARFKSLDVSARNLSAYIVRGVRSSNFGYNPKTDTDFGERNQKILAAFRTISPSVVIGESGNVDITQAIRLQLERHGVPGHRIQTDTTDTYNDRDFGDFIWWSHERAMANGDKKEAVECRNMVLVLNP